ncbi:matrixin family metalloprotease [Hansschlegelia sp. KR7-227]|uniref:matrixin family metalloprotease n=1 Tax=Hansschlegelia sp. KR7-227 TaxID=3400914 RepID=UPI003BFD9443
MPTADPEIDVRDPSNPFLAALIRGQIWHGVQDAPLTYNFSTITYTNTGVTTYTWKAAEKAAFRKAVAAFESVIDIDFQETASAENSDFNWFLDPSPAPEGDLAAHALPSGPQAGNGLFYVDEYDDWSGQLKPGGFAFSTIIHEIGHGLGLDHPHSGSPRFPGVDGPLDTGTNDQNSWLYTVMSYKFFGASQNGQPHTAAEQGAISFPDGLMAFDIAALQYLYGANTSFASGDDVYTLTNATASLHCIWDTGGRDMIRYGGTRAVAIDLTEASLKAGDIYAGGRISFVDQVLGGFTIANGVDIEDATGGSGSDQLWGNALANRLAGSGGDDTLFGGVGRDDLVGGAGVDTAHLGDKTSRIQIVLDAAGDATAFVGGKAEDSLSGIENVLSGSGADVLEGNARANELQGGSGDDTLVASDGALDVLTGGRGVDWLDLRELPDAAKVEVFLQDSLGSGVTRVDGRAVATIFSIENVRGHDGRDAIVGNAQDNVLLGQAGDDSLRGAEGADTLDGGGGIDLASYRGEQRAVSIALNGRGDAMAFVNGREEDALRGIENLRGGERGDMLQGNARANRLEGGEGDDTLVGSAGVDTLDGGAGVDLADFNGVEAPTRLLILLGGDDRGFVASTDGSIEAELISIEDVRGSQSADEIVGDDRANRITGGFGDDTIAGGDGVDTLDGENGSNTLSYRAETASVSVRLDGSTFTAAVVDLVVADRVRNFQNVIGGAAGDFLYGGGDANRLEGADGDDALRGGGGFDTLDGGAGRDAADYSLEKASVRATLKGPDAATATVGGKPADQLFSIENLIGGSAADTLTGDMGDNLLSGSGGDDQLGGAAGDDTLVGGTGFDRMDGGAGFDVADYSDEFAALKATLSTGNAYVSLKRFDAAKNAFVNEDGLKFIEKLIGGLGSDSFEGSIGGDHLFGGFGADTIDGYFGSDVINGGQGKDQLDGGASRDGDFDVLDYGDAAFAIKVTLNGATFADVTIGGAVEDSVRNFEGVIGGLKADVITGDDGANRLVGGDGADTLTGGAGADTLIGGAGRDRIDGGAKVYNDINGQPFVNFDQADTLDYGDKTYSFRLTLAAVDTSKPKPATATAIFSDGERDTIQRIENVVGGAGNDLITGNNVNNRLFGGDGADSIDGGAADDTVSGGAGHDVLKGGAGSDQVMFDDATGGLTVRLGADGAASVVQIGGVAADTISQFENVVGGAFDDRFTGNESANFFLGGAGADIFVGGAGPDQYQGGDGSDLVDYSAMTENLAVYLRYEDGAERGYAFFDGVLKDTLSTIENVRGGSGNDNLRGGAGANAINGGAGADTLYGLAGSDTLTGGTGADKFVFGGLSSAAGPGVLAIGDIGVDRVTDFGVADDLIRIDLRTFDPGHALPVLTADTFGVGRTFGDRGSDDVLFYSQGDGGLWFDLDASGGGAAVRIAALSRNLALEFSNFEFFNPV